MPRRHPPTPPHRVYSTARKWSTLGILDRLKYEVIKEELFDSEHFPLVAGMRRCWGGGYFQTITFKALVNGRVYPHINSFVFQGNLSHIITLSQYDTR